MTNGRRRATSIALVAGVPCGQPACVNTLSEPRALFGLASLFFAQAPMPEPATLVKEIGAHQRKMDELRENYTFNEVTLTDELGKNGAVSRTDQQERNVFFVNGYRIARLVRRNGKELNEGESKERAGPRQ